MADNTTIEWARHPVTGKGATWNPVTGCALVSEGCRHCYAARLAATRLKNVPSRKGLARLNAAGEAKFTGEVRLNETELLKPLSWRAPRGIFADAHGDMFAENVPDEWIDRQFAIMALTPQHIYFVLTKRPERMRDYFTHDDGFGRWGFIEGQAIKVLREAGRDPSVLAGKTLANYGGSNLPNVWLGTSVEDQPTADTRIPPLLGTPAAKRFISAEPLLGPVDLTPWMLLLDWVIAGGESGPKARPMHPDWVRTIRDQCGDADVPFLFKQWGAWADLTNEPRTTAKREDRIFLASGEVLGAGNGREGMVALNWQERGAAWMSRVGKSKAGRTLDGVLHDAMPEPTA